jgi:hypothetical protein
MVNMAFKVYHIEHIDSIDVFGGIPTPSEKN